MAVSEPTYGSFAQPRLAAGARSLPVSRLFLLWLVCVCLGYALLGRGFAYIGTFPVFIGEVTLLLSLLVCIGTGLPRVVLRHPLVWLMVLMWGWGLLRTWPYLSAHGADAVRDAALFGYSVLAVTVMALLVARPWLLAALVRWAPRLAIAFLVLLPLVHFLVWTMPERIPVWPGTNVRWIEFKSGDIQVHLAGALLLMLGALARLSYGWLLLLAPLLVLHAAGNRGGMVAFVAAVAAGAAAQLRFRGLVLLVVVLIGGFALMASLDVRIERPGSMRALSTAQIVENVTSLWGAAEDHRLAGTSEWRLAWWGQIVDYTVRGPYFWTGKGFGVNLAAEDGFLTSSAENRSPHNSHMSVLARTGVPGLALWAAMLGGWLWLMGRHARRARRLGRMRWRGLFLFLGGYAIAFLVNACFDVFLEGPMGAIPFWSVIGVGLAASWIHRHRPEILEPERGEDAA